MQEQKNQAKLQIINSEEIQHLFGPNDRFLKEIERELEIQVITRNGEITVSGLPEQLKKAESLFSVLLRLIRSGYTACGKGFYLCDSVGQGRYGRFAHQNCLRK